VSQENVEIARRAMAEFNERGLPGLLEFADPEIEWTTTGRYVEAGTYRGYDGIRQYLGAVLAEFDDARTDADEYIDRGGLESVLRAREAQRHPGRVRDDDRLHRQG
jgi:ketosteroid isomerase-like protein